MWIYFVEQVWNYEDSLGWKKLGWETKEAMRRYWDLHETSVHGYAYNRLEWLEEGSDWEDY